MDVDMTGACQAIYRHFHISEVYTNMDVNMTGAIYRHFHFSEVYMNMVCVYIM